MHGRLAPGVAIIAAAALAVALLPAPPAAHAGALAILLGIVPGFPIARRVAEGRGPCGIAALAVALSPLIAGAAGAVMLAAHVPAVWAARVVVVAAVLLAAADAWRREGAAEDTPEPGWDLPVLAAALAGVGIVALAFAFNPALPRRSDAGYHAAVALAVARGGVVPPEDPFFAGLRLLYFWGFHVWASAWLALEPRLAVWTPLVFANLMGTFAALAGVGLLARRLGATAGAVALAAFLACFGTAPFAWAWDVARALTGEVRGLADLSRLLGNGVDVALASMSVGLLHPSLVFAADKLLVSSPFALGLGLACAWVLGMMELVARPDRRAALAVALPLAAAFFLHPFVGMTLLGLGSWTWLVLVVQSRSEGTAERGAAARRLAPALIVPVLLLLPYLIAIALGQHPVAATGQPPFLRALSSLALAGALVVPAALVWLRHRRGAAERVLWTACWALAVGALALRVPGNNQTKVLNLLFFVASAPAAMGWIAWLRRRAPRVRALAIAALGLATIPTLAFCAWAYVHERDQGAHDYREPRGDDAAAYAWVARATPASALLVDTADEASGGTTASVSARRTMLWGGEWNARLIGYAPEALAVRRTTAQDLAGGWPLQPASIALLGNLGREVYVIEHRAPGRRPLDASAAYRRVFTSGTVSVLRWEAPR